MFNRTQHAPVTPVTPAASCPRTSSSECLRLDCSASPSRRQHVPVTPAARPRHASSTSPSRQQRVLHVHRAQPRVVQARVPVPRVLHLGHHSQPTQQRGEEGQHDSGTAPLTRVYRVDHACAHVCVGAEVCRCMRVCIHMGTYVYVCVCVCVCAHGWGRGVASSSTCASCFHVCMHASGCMWVHVGVAVGVACARVAGGGGDQIVLIGSAHVYHACMRVDSVDRLTTRVSCMHACE